MRVKKIVITSENVRRDLASADYFRRELPELMTAHPIFVENFLIALIKWTFEGACGVESGAIHPALGFGAETEFPAEATDRREERAPPCGAEEETAESEEQRQLETVRLWVPTRSRKGRSHVEWEDQGGIQVRMI